MLWLVSIITNKQGVSTLARALYNDGKLNPLSSVLNDNTQSKPMALGIKLGLS